VYAPSVDGVFLFGRKEGNMNLSKRSFGTIDKEKAVPIRSISWGQCTYKYAACPVCGSANGYRDGRTKCYCSQCGQKLKWVDHEKIDSKKKIKSYKIVFRIVSLKDIEFRIIKAINMFEAISTFHLFTMRQRVDVLEAYEVVEKDD